MKAANLATCSLCSLDSKDVEREKKDGMFLMMDFKWCMQIVSPFLLRLICIEFSQALRNDSYTIVHELCYSEKLEQIHFLEKPELLQSGQKNENGKFWKMDYNQCKRSLTFLFGNPFHQLRLKLQLLHIWKWKVFEYGYKQCK